MIQKGNNFKKPKFYTTYYPIIVLLNDSKVKDLENQVLFLST